MIIEKIKSIYNNLIKFEFIRYLLVGGFATIMDWSLFYILAILLQIHYQIAVVISFSAVWITHYSLNKVFTFKCKSKKIIKQFSLLGIATIASLFLGMFIMFILVEVILIEKMISKILTTGILVIVNYTIHKNITFNKRFFK